MPEEDDDALGEMLGDRIKGTKGDTEDQERDDTTEPSSEAEAESVSGSDASEATSQGDTESTQITRSTETSSAKDDAEGEPEPEPEPDSETDGTVRSRSPFPLYVTPDLKETVQNRFERFNAQRTLNDKTQVEKHKHFMEGLLRAGLDHPDLEEYVLDEFTDDEQ